MPFNASALFDFPSRFTFSPTAHGAKASAPVAVNASPEPVSNRTLSTLEDAMVVFLSWMAAVPPIITAGIFVVLVALCVLAIRKLFVVFRRIIGGRWFRLGLP